MYFLAAHVLVEVIVVCVVPSLYSVVFRIRVAWMCLVCFMLYKEKNSYPVS